MSSTRVATFDCYGTLIDWEGGVGAFLYELARRHERRPAAGARAARALGGAPVRAHPGRLAPLPRRPGRQPGRLGRRARLPLGRGRRRAARPRDGELAAVPGHRPGPARGARGGPARCGSSRTPTAPSSSTACATWRSTSTASPWRRTVAPTSRRRCPSTRRCARSACRARRSCTWPSGSSTTSARRSSSACGTAWVNRKQEQAPGPERPDHEWTDLWWPLAEVAG